jgi:hypothetical protein
MPPVDRLTVCSPASVAGIFSPSALAAACSAEQSSLPQDPRHAHDPAHPWLHHATMITLKGKSHRLKERGTGIAPATPVHYSAPVDTRTPCWHQNAVSRSSPPAFEFIV